MKKKFWMFLNDCIVSFLSQFFADEQLMIFLILITRLFDSALVLLGEIFDDKNRSSRLLPAVWHLVKSLLIQQSVRLLRAVYGACDGRRKYWMSSKKKQRKKKTKTKTAYTWNFDGLDYHGSALVSYCPVVSANREGTGEMHVPCTWLKAWWPRLWCFCQAHGVLFYSWLCGTLLSPKLWHIITT